MVGYALSGAAFILVVNALVGENGYLATLRARRESAQLEEQLNRLRDENRQMRERIKRLNTDPAELEDSARKELRLIKPGETIVIVKDEKKPAAPQEPGK